MMTPFRAFQTALFVALTVTPAHARELAGVKMPDRIDVSGKPLTLNGMGVRRATILNVKVYVAGLYLEAPSADAAAIIHSPETKALILLFTRDVAKDRVVRTIDEHFRRNAGGAMASLEPRLAELERLLPALKEHQTLAFTYGPSPSVEIRVDGATRGTVGGEDFARVLWSIWLGTEPADEGLKKGLLGSH
jgi:hypothetical protein